MTPQEVLKFWLDECEPKDWYVANDAIDTKICKKFSLLWENAAGGGLGLWLTNPSETLAYIILTDQFSRNMHRGSREAFALDANARKASKIAINREWDMRIDEPARQFFYMPLMHSENQCDQDRAVRLFHTRMPETGHLSLEHARAHREIIRRFGRFPFRNEALERKSSAAEIQFLENGGYGAIVRELQVEKSAA